MNYTIVGDTVNLCQRLQDLGKQAAPDEEVAILMSDETRSRLSADHFALGLGEHFVKGRSAGVKVWNLTGKSAASLKVSQTRQTARSLPAE